MPVVAHHDKVARVIADSALDTSLRRGQTALTFLNLNGTRAIARMPLLWASQTFRYRHLACEGEGRMGAIWLSGASLFGSLSDFIGTKSGLALNRDQIGDIFCRDGRFEMLHKFSDDEMLRLRSERFEEMIELLLFSVGRLERINNPLPFASVYHKHKKNKLNMKIVYKIGNSWIEFLEEEINNPNLKRGEKIDPSRFLINSLRSYGKFGFEIAKDIMTNYIIRQQIQSSYSPFPQISEWENTTQLKALFEQENLDAFYGKFFDQRYIDYLNRNFDDIDKINWRKFEGLTAEYFDRLGFRVDVGPGRNDDGVDVRVWPPDDALGGPPAMIVQCKRQKQSVEKVIVKSLYADLVDAQAKSGLIVTTSKLSPGARAVCTARQYPIHEADRDLIRSWIAEMRTPGLGVAT
jgi:restriction system protein